tara:strand:- start:2289 stop:3698 length:1410 start_codon:yes stop_codon:yes gene_type:complete
LATEKKQNINLKKNLADKKYLIDELKNLINHDGKMSQKYLEFKKIQENWFKIGPVPRAESQILWNNFQHHVKNFYDYLHLNRKFKEIDVNHNLSEKKKIIQQVKKLIDIEDRISAHKFLERLKKRWKYELGPVEKKEDTELSKEFKNLGEKIIENKKEFDQNRDTITEENLIKKNDLLNEIKKIISKETNTSKEWQKKIKEFENIKIKLNKVGPIPSKKRNNYWKNYKATIKDFYLIKNIFFKNLKKIYRENIFKQEDLINKIEILKKNKNLESIKKEIILIQREWKNISPVPYKINEKNWKKFRLLCDHFFNKVDSEKENKLTELKNNEEKQKKFINSIQSKSQENNLDEILKKWKQLGSKKDDIENQFEKVVINIIKSSGLNEENSRTKLFEFKSQIMDSVEKNKKISILNKELDILKKEVSTLENNLSFFNEKSKESELLNKVHKDIKKNKKQIEKIIAQKKILKN